MSAGQDPFIPPFAGIPQSGKCHNCAHGIIAPGPDGQVNIKKRYCIEGPPQSVPIPQYKRGISGIEPVGVQIMVIFPEVDVTQHCHKWQPKMPEPASKQEVN